MEGGGLGRGVSSALLWVTVGEAWSRVGVIGEGAEEKVLECGVLAAALAVSSNSTYVERRIDTNVQFNPHSRLEYVSAAILISF